MSRGTLDTATQLSITHTGLSPSLAGFPKTILLSIVDGVYSPTTPEGKPSGLALFPLSLAAT